MYSHLTRTKQRSTNLSSHFLRYLRFHSVVEDPEANHFSWPTYRRRRSNPYCSNGNNRHSPTLSSPPPKKKNTHVLVYPNGIVCLELKPALIHTNFVYNKVQRYLRLVSYQTTLNPNLRFGPCAAYMVNSMNNEKSVIPTYK